MENQAPQRRQFDYEKTYEIVLNNAQSQSTPEHRENYLRGCEKHGEDLTKVAADVRAKLTA